ncbi:hypothetical protein Rhal01_00828 [Rubritalea halochordaticola]|uniref:DUF4261 domain-containing protein n=1 Tax=Rubritalea halochordaticola TaxID=714537 RepID=A0ABP9UY83_9BACT
MKLSHLTATLLLSSVAFLSAEEKTAAPPTKSDIPEGLVPLAPKQTTHFAFLCLKDKEMAKDADIKAALMRWFQLKDESEIVRYKQDPQKGTLSFTIGKARFVAALAEYSIPAPDLQYASNNSLHWPDAEKELLQQQAHYTVTCTSIYPKKWMTSLALSKAISALAETHHPLGIYWGDASIVHSPETFIKLSKQELRADNKNIPADLWVGILLEKHKDGTVSAYTDGLRVLGFREMEIQNSQLDRTKAYSILSALSLQVVRNNQTIQENEEVATPEDGSYPTKLGDSNIGRKQKVIVISAQ